MTLPRLMLVELEDLPWWPRWLRDPMTGYLHAMIVRSRLYAVAAEPLAGLLRASGERQIVDLASGGGGPWPELLDDVASHGVEAEVTCTDLFPPSLRPEEAELSPLWPMRYHPESVSALEVPSSLRGVRTMFSALHHFAPHDVGTLVRSVERDRVAFASFDGAHRSIVGVILTILVPLMVVLVMPFVRPRRLSTLLFTYLVPILPLVIWWDGFVSMWRAYRATELQALVDQYGTASYRWDVRLLKARSSPLPVTCLVGVPRELAA